MTRLAPAVLCLIVAVGCTKKAAPDSAGAPEVAKAEQAKATGSAPAGTAAENAAAVPKPAGDTPAKKPTGPMRVFFIEPKDNANVVGEQGGDGMVEISIKMGIEGMLVKPAGDKTDNSGHHHILVDSGPIPAREPVPKDATHIHFGDGRSDAVIRVAPGRRKLTMQFADYAHLSYGPNLAASIEIDVVGKPPTGRPLAPPPGPRPAAAGMPPGGAAMPAGAAGVIATPPPGIPPADAPPEAMPGATQQTPPPPETAPVPATK